MCPSLLAVTTRMVHQVTTFKTTKAPYVVVTDKGGRRLCNERLSQVVTSDKGSGIDEETT